MTNVKVKNKITLLLVISLLIGCKGSKIEAIPEQSIKKPLVFNVKFKTFENIKLAYDDEKMLVDSTIWKDHLQDSIVYFKINFENLKKEPIILKIDLVGSKIPFFLKYSKGAEDKVILEVFQQFNTIYSDSIIFKKIDIAGFPIVDQAFRVGYQHNGIDEICQLNVNQHQDTIDISNQKMVNCIEKKR